MKSQRGTGRTHRQLEAVAARALKGSREVYVTCNSGVIDGCADMLLKIVPPSTNARLIRNKREVVFRSGAGGVVFLAAVPGRVHHQLDGCRNVTIDHAVHGLRDLTRDDRAALARAMPIPEEASR